MRWGFTGLARRHADRTLAREQQELILREWRTLYERLRPLAEEHVAAVGARLQASGPAADGPLRAGAERDYRWALDAYEAAGKLLDEAADLPDLAAAIVLADRAVERSLAAAARQAGRQPAKPVTRCRYNPLHGVAAAAQKPSRRRRTRPREAVADRHPACAGCRAAILAGEPPDVLPALVPVRVGRRRAVRVLVPYYALPQQFSLWSTSACGARGDDIPPLVLRGEHRRRRPALQADPAA